MMVAVIKRSEPGTICYTGDNKEVLFSVRYWPEDLFARWFGKLDRVVFLIGGNEYVIRSRALTEPATVWHQGTAFGMLEYAGSDGVKLVQDGNTIAWTKSDGILVGIRKYEGWCQPGAHCFVNRPPYLSEWWGGPKVWKRTANLVGEFDATMKDNVPVALLFMYADLFLDVG